MKKRLIVLILLFFCFTLSGCKTITIMELHHKDSEIFYKEYNLYNTKLDKFKVNGILFVPYTIYTEEKGFLSYDLMIDIYKDESDNSNVMIKQVTIKGVKNVSFKEIKKDINKAIIFRRSEEKPTLSNYYSSLISPINNYNIKIKKNGSLKVILNIMIEKNNVITNKKVEYLLEPDELIFYDNYFTRH